MITHLRYFFLTANILHHVGAMRSWAAATVLPVCISTTVCWCERMILSARHSIHQHHRPRLVPCRHCSGRTHVCVRRGWIETHSRRRAVRCRHGHRRSELPLMALSWLAAVRRGCDVDPMTSGRRVNLVHRSLSRPLTILGAERKLSFFAMS